MTSDEYWMNIAIEEAKLAMRENEVPVGAVLVGNNKFISKAHNQSIMFNDPSAHAEIQLLRKAGEEEKNYRLLDTTLYVTLEPCTMCFGAMIHARIKKLVFGARDPKSGVCGSAINLPFSPFYNHRIEVDSGILEKECKQILKDFFLSKRNKNFRTLNLI
tara:strand:+ start:53 stop:532 length:480 start_codon:yes stop_codon:yes gene_type:complete